MSTRDRPTTVLIVLTSLLLPVVACEPGENAAADDPAVHPFPGGREPAGIDLRFRIGKWEDAQGLKRVPVTGRFRSVELRVPPLCKSAACLLGAEAQVNVDLTSLDTNLPVRDGNIMRAYFDTDAYPRAQADLRVVSAEDQAGGLIRVQAAVDLQLHGARVALGPVALELTPHPAGFHVRTLAPLEVSSAAFGMPVTALLALCGHVGIDPAAAVELEGMVPLDSRN